MKRHRLAAKLRARRFTAARHDSDWDWNDDSECNWEPEWDYKGSESEWTESKSVTLHCSSCLKDYESTDGGTCKACSDKGREVEDGLRREIEDLRDKIDFLRFWSPSERDGFSDVVLVASGDGDGGGGSVPAHKAVLASCSPVFRAMFENEMQESQTGIIKIDDASHDALISFVNYLYTGDAPTDEQTACELLVLSDKYEVNQLKTHCEKFLVSKLSRDKSVASYAFARQHDATQLRDSALSMMIEDIGKLGEQERYRDLVEEDPRLVVEIYEAYVMKCVTAPCDEVRKCWEECDRDARRSWELFKTLGITAQGSEEEIIHQLRKEKVERVRGRG